jgi:hypothetical protein
MSLLSVEAGASDLVPTIRCLSPVPLCHCATRVYVAEGCTRFRYAALFCWNKSAKHRSGDCTRCTGLPWQPAVIYEPIAA